MNSQYQPPESIILESRRGNRLKALEGFVVGLVFVVTYLALQFVPTEKIFPDLFFEIPVLFFRVTWQGFVAYSLILAGVWSGFFLVFKASKFRGFTSKLISSFLIVAINTILFMFLLTNGDFETELLVINLLNTIPAVIIAGAISALTSKIYLAAVA